MISSDDTAVPVASRAERAAAVLRTWLLHGPAQLRSGPHSGGVAGAIGNDGRPRYVYPEITGYYLHWLADAHRETERETSVAAVRRAIDWATRELADGRVPATRGYLVDAAPDWRNDAVFFFDLSMLLRGLLASAEAGLADVPRFAVDRLVDELAAFADDSGTIRAARVLHGDALLPARWSTLGGPFLVKATSRVALASRHAALPSALRDGCEDYADRHFAQTATMPLEMLHPTLYFAEGILVARPDSATAVARLLARCLALGNADGSLPESDSGSVVPRSDIVAQALRVGVQLRAANVAGAPDDAALDALANVLVARLTPGGAMPFRADVDANESNVWCSMFAEQALRWYARWRRGDAVAAVEWLV
jgi:hypothetical protein